MKHVRILRTMYGSWALRGYRFYVGPKRFVLRAGGVRTLELLAEMVEKWLDAERPARLVSLRAQIREIEHMACRAALCLAIESTADERLRRLAIWLRGRCRGTLGTSIVARYRTSPDPAIRKEVARALMRMDGWAELRQMEREDPDPRVRRMAVQPSPRPYAARLDSFVRCVPRLDVEPDETPLIVAPDVDPAAGRPPKPAWLIGMILERIHRLVSGLAHPAKPPPPVRVNKGN